MSHPLDYNVNSQSHPTKTVESQDLWGLSQSELISKLQQSQSKVEQLENLFRKLGKEVSPKPSSQETAFAAESQDKNENNSPTASQPPPTQDKLGIDKSIERRDFESSFALVPSPCVTTPPYEYIVLTKNNESKFRIFVNPKIDSVFKEELVKLKSQEQELEGDESDETAIKVENKLGTNPPVLPLPHNCSETTVIHCFDPSDVDVQLKHIFKANPPVIHKIVRRKSRLERGSSVPAIDSYYGTQDLERVGHASYFIPDLTPSEKKIIGWKEQYSYGLWKYAKQNIPNVISQNISSGKSFFSRISLKDMVRKSKSGHKNKTYVTTPVAANLKILEQGSKDVCKVESIHRKFKFPFGGSNKNTDSIQSFQQEEMSSILESPCSSEDVSPSHSCFRQNQNHSFNKNGHALQNLVRCLIPCYKHRRSNEDHETQVESDLFCESRTNSNKVLIVSEEVNSTLDINSRNDSKQSDYNHQQHQNSPMHKKKDHHHRHHHRHHQNHHQYRDKMLLGCFHHNRPTHNQSDEVVGGDVLLSADDSIISIIHPISECHVQEEHSEPIKITAVTTTSLITKSSRTDETETPFRNDFNQFDNNNTFQHSCTASDVKLQSDNIIHEKVTKSFSATVTESTIQSPSMQVSTNSLCSGHDYEDGNYLPDDPDEYVEDEYYDDDGVEEYENNYDETYLDNGNNHKYGNNEETWCENREDVFETVPETRFLDLKDLSLSRYQYKKPTKFNQDEAHDYENYEGYDDEYEYDENDEYYDDEEFANDVHLFSDDYIYATNCYPNANKSGSLNNNSNNNNFKNGGGAKNKMPLDIQDCQIV